MNYGDRQERAEMLSKTFRAQSQKVFSWKDQRYTGEEIALEIEGMTDLGKALVATAALVMDALKLTPSI